MTALSPEELEQYRVEGYVGPFTHPLLADPDGLRKRALEAVVAAIPKLAYPGIPVEKVLPERLDAGLPWFKSVHLLVPELWEIAQHPAIRDRVRSIIGPDVMWWGTAVIQKKPGDVHGWHYDIEYQGHDNGVLLHLGLEGLEPRSALKFITRTHSQRKPPSAFTDDTFVGIEGGPTLGSDEKVLAIAREHVDAGAELVLPEMYTGDFIIAHGHTWHGSRHAATASRTALVMHFGPPDTDVRIPTSFGSNPSWYAKRPACAMLCGSAHGKAVNPLVAQPSAVR